MTAKLVVLSPLQAHIYEGGREITDRSITYNEHNRIEVECKASGSKSNKIDFKWSADGNRLTSNDHIKINGGKLIIEKASYDDVRVYQCLADDGDNGVAHGTVSINIQCELEILTVFTDLHNRSSGRKKVLRILLTILHEDFHSK